MQQCIIYFFIFYSKIKLKTEGREIDECQNQAKQYQAYKMSMRKAKNTSNVARSDVKSSYSTIYTNVVPDFTLYYYTDENSNMPLLDALYEYHTNCHSYYKLFIDYAIYGIVYKNNIYSGDDLKAFFEKCINGDIIVGGECHNSHKHRNDSDCDDTYPMTYIDAFINVYKAVPIKHDVINRALYGNNECYLIEGINDKSASALYLKNDMTQLMRTLVNQDIYNECGNYLTIGINDNDICVVSIPDIDMD